MARADDPHDLDRFLQAQADTYADALGEIRAGRKQTHWMWFIFPQLEGLGLSSISRHYAIKTREEAHAYVAHPILGPRLTECAEALLGVEGRTVGEIFGAPDDMKLRSSMTLFASVLSPGNVFDQVLQRYFGGEPDGITLKLLAEEL